MKVNRTRRESGNSIVEVALLSPWIFFLFVGIFDLGFYTYAVICTENAARAAAIQTASGSGPGVQSPTDACAIAWDELKGLPNVAGITTPTCNALPVVVTQTTLCAQATVKPTSIVCTDPGPCTDCGNTTDPTGRAASSRVTVQYQSIPLVPIPGILTGRTTITRIAEMRIIAE